MHGDGVNFVVGHTEHGNRPSGARVTTNTPASNVLYPRGLLRNLRPLGAPGHASATVKLYQGACFDGAS